MRFLGYFLFMKPQKNTKFTKSTLYKSKTFKKPLKKVKTSKNTLKFSPWSIFSFFKR